MDKQFLIDLALFVFVTIAGIWIVTRPNKKDKAK